MTRIIDTGGYDSTFVRRVLELEKATHSPNPFLSRLAEQKLRELGHASGLWEGPLYVLVTDEAREALARVWAAPE